MQDGNDRTTTTICTPILDDTNKDKCDKLDWADLVAMTRVEIGKVVLENLSHFEGVPLELEKNTI